MRNKILFLFLILTVTFEAFSQSVTYPVSNTGTRSDFNAYNTTTNLYTGQLNYSIPIAALNNGLDKLDIALSYHTTGTKINDIASSVGLGWSIDIPAISRAVVGAPDELTYTKNGTQKYVGYWWRGNINLSPSKNDLDNVFKNYWDTEADLFYINLPEFSGQIVLDINGAFSQTVPISDLSVSIQRNSSKAITAFTVTTPEGKVYEFSEYNSNMFKYRNLDNDDLELPFTSQWFLKKIYSTSNPSKTINLQYQNFSPNDTLYKINLSASPDNVNIATAMAVGATLSPSCHPVWFAVPGLITTITNKGTQKRLQEIASSFGDKIVFNYGGYRKDLPGDMYLSNIDAVNSRGSIINKLNLGYVYDEAGVLYPSNYSPTGNTYLTRRLLLNKVSFLSGNSQESQHLNFEYDQTIPLPSRITNGDDWGYMDKSTSYPEGGANALTLIKINSSLGAETQFVYEKNNISWTSGVLPINGEVGGVRIKNIQYRNLLANDSNDYEEHEFTYVNDDNTSSGQLKHLPMRKFQTFFNVNAITSACQIGGVGADHALYNNTSNLSVAPVLNIGYSRVIENIKNNATNIGKKVYYYKNYKDYEGYTAISGSQGDLAFPYPNKTTYIPWGLGLAYKSEIYHSNGSIVEKNESQFSVEASRLSNIAVASQKVGLFYGPYNRSASNVNGEVYSYESYYPISGTVQLLGSKVVKFENNASDSLKAITDFEYVPGKNLIRSAKRVDSKGVLHKTIYYYPFDYSLPYSEENSGVIEMNNRGILSTSVVTEDWIEKSGQSFLANSTVTTYRVLNNVITPFKTYQLTALDPIPEYNYPVFTTSTLFRDISKFREVVSNDLYDGRANILQVTSDKVKKNAVVWGYNGQYEVARVMGMDYTTVLQQSLVDTALLNNINSTPQAIAAELQKLRNNLKGKGVLVTTATYEPLVGKTSETDAAGVTVYYEYDMFKQLALIKDHNGNIVKRLCLSYTGQPDACPISSQPLPITPNWLLVEGSIVCLLNPMTGNPNGTANWKERDLNPGSPTFLQYRDVYGYDHADVCIGDNYCLAPGECETAEAPEARCIGERCEIGVKVYIPPMINPQYPGDFFQCKYRYEWSDGFQSPVYTEYSQNPCD